ncbi:efflux RND transporter periplasmic adaptor subunit [Falsiphaeobacter marinintestinus]|uniref:efflux RND transporter periplasmic adaptor subunit n=1 Tax=Falsiphaeobacter marinintestinus TaxID=1492905 RepID=UPI0016461230|nr:biotin/lipoyl-binding protein [Phaeobacter marinintestinus]
MVIILAGYGLIVWLLFFKFEVLPWRGSTKTMVALIGLAIVLVVMALLNTRTPSGRIAVMAPVIQVASIVSGTVIEVPVAANTRVNEGDVLVRLDPRPFEYAVQLAEANQDIAEKTYQRKKTAFDLNQATVSEQSVDEADAALQAANAQLQQARYNLDHTVITTAADGVITGLRLSEGDLVTANTGIMPMVRDDAVVIGGVFEQNGWGVIKPGSEIGLTFARYPGQVFWTTVAEKVFGTSGGQVMVGANLLDQADIGSSSEALIRIVWPAQLQNGDLPIGAVGSATVIGENAGPMGVIAKVLLWIKAYREYL